MAKTLKTAGAQSATWLVSTDDPSPALVILDETDWALLPSGKLRDLMLAKYASDTALFQALSVAGVLTSQIAGPSFSTSFGISNGSWNADAVTGYPNVSIIFDNTPTTATYTIACAYSATE